MDVSHPGGCSVGAETAFRNPRLTHLHRAIHRGDYQMVLLEETLKAGAEVMTDADVVAIEPSADIQQTLVLKNGRRMAKMVQYTLAGTAR